MVKKETLTTRLLAVLVFGIASFVVLASVSPPNLGETLAAQRQLTLERPYDAAVHNDHGNLLVLAGRHEEAAGAYRRAIELAPAATLARYNLGILLQQSGRPKEALAALQGLLEIEPENARAHYQMGMLFHARKQRAKAVKHYARAFAYDPELTFAVVNPHIIDNELATEAILASRRYGEAPSSSIPRLYGEPERIADLMLGPLESAAEESEVDEGDDDDDLGDERTGSVRSSARASFEDDDEDEDDRRILTREDLEAGSSVGQAQSAGRPARRGSSANRDRSRSGRLGGVAPVVPLTRSSEGRDAGAERRSTGGRPNAVRPGGGASNVGRDPVRRAPRYIPGRQVSTGRLRLELLPAGSESSRDSVTATR